MSKTLLIINAGFEAVPGIQLAKKMGLHVVVSDMDPHAPGFDVADDHIIASTYDAQETVVAAQTYHHTVRPLDGVMCMAADVPHSVAAVAEALQLPGIPVDVAHRAMDKLAMKERFRADGVPVPDFYPVISCHHLKELVAECGYPLVLKPVDSRGSRGVIRLTPEVDLAWAFTTAEGYSPTQRVMVERFLDGPQVSTESIVVDGAAATPGFSDRNYEYLERYAPFFVENGGSLPSHLPSKMQKAICTLVEEGARSLGVSNGVVKGDIVVHGDRPYIIELAARLSGGFFSSHEIPLNTGVSTVEAVIKLALGERLSLRELKPKFQRPVAQRYLFLSPGRITGIHNLAKAKAQPGIVEIVVNGKVGDQIDGATNATCSLAMVIAMGESVAEAVVNAERAVETIEIEMA